MSKRAISTAPPRTATMWPSSSFNAGRRADALEYAEAALRGFESYGAGAAEEITEARRLIAAIRGG